MQLVVDQYEGFSIVTIPGDVLDAYNTKQFKHDMQPLLQAGCKVVLDMGLLRFVDSSGIGALVSCLRQVRAIEGELKLCGLTKPVRAVFELVRMHQLFEIFSTKEDAIRALSPRHADAA